MKPRVRFEPPRMETPRRRVRTILLISIAIALLAGCGGPFDLLELVDGPDGTPLTVSPARGTLAVNEAVPLIAEGGLPPYGFRVSIGSGTMSDNVYAAPSVAGEERIVVSDSLGSEVEVVFTITGGALAPPPPPSDPLSLSPSAQTVYTGQSISFTATGGGPFTYAITDNQSGAGTMSGGSYTAGSAAGTDTITVTDESDGATATAVVTVQAKPFSIAPLAISVTVGQTVTFSAVGGDGPFTYAITDNQSGAAAMSGASYTAGATAGTDTVQVTDGYDGRSVEAQVTVSAAGAATSVDYAVQAISSITGGTKAGAAFTAASSVANIGTADGSEDISWAVYASADTTVGGADSVVDSGVIAGGVAAGSSKPIAIAGVWPREAGSYYLLIQVAAADELSGGNNGNQSAAATAIAEELSLSPSAQTVYTGQSISFTATGGGPFTYAITDNQSGAGTMSGGSYTAGSAAGTDTITVTDESDGATATAVVTVQVKPFSIAPLAVSVTVGQTVTFSAVGGDGPFTYAITDNQSGAGTMSGGSYTAGSAAGTDTITVTDESDGATATAVVTVQVAPPAPSPDHELVSVSATVVGTTTGDPVTGAVDITNVGTGDGNHDISWTVYASADTAVGGNDVIVDSGSISALASGATESASYAGTWPQSAGSYYLVAAISAADDSVSGNNEGYTASVTAITDPPAPAVEYEVSSITVSGPTPAAGSLLSESFTLRNTGPDAGSSSIVWNAYLSADAALSVGSDTLLASGTISPLAGDDGAAGGADETTIPFSGSWPESPGTYYIIVSETADDESSPGEALASSPAAVQVATVDVDYHVSVPPAGGTRSPGSGMSENFTIENRGSDSGSAMIYWRVYISDDESYGVDDILVDNGTSSGLVGGGSTGAITMTGTWPSTSGEYYLIVRHSAADDIDSTNDSRLSESYFVASSGVVDYRVTHITMDQATPNAGSPIEEGFTVTNLGTTSGTAPFDWNLYISSDAALDAGDTLADSGTGVPALSSGSSHTVSSVGAAWPTTTGTYYLLVEVIAGDEGNPDNDVECQGVYDVVSPPDYTVGSYAVPLIEAETETRLDTAGSFTFTIRNDGEDGSEPIAWNVYASLNSGVDGTDTLLKSGYEPALGAGQTGATIEFGDAIWPAFGSRYYIVISLASDDDETPHNNILALGPIMVPQVHIEGSEDNDAHGKTQVPLVNVTYLDSVVDAAGGLGLSPHQLVRVDAQGEDSSRHDTMAFTIGSGVASIRTYAEWSDAVDLLELYMWDEDDWEATARIDANFREPDTGYLTGTGWTDGERAYVSPKFRVSGPYPYSLYIEALP